MTLRETETLGNNVGPIQTKPRIVGQTLKQPTFKKKHHVLCNFKIEV